VITLLDVLGVIVTFYAYAFSVIVLLCIPFVVVHLLTGGR
jgi:hypothetical protein